MKRIVLFLLCFSISLPALAHASGSQYFGRLSTLKDIDDYLTEAAEEEAAEAAQKDDEEDDNSAVLDDKGRKTYEELKAWVEQNPEEFARMVAEDDAVYGKVEENEPGVEESEESPAELGDPGSYCPDPNSEVFTWEAKTKKKSKRSRGGGRRGGGGRGRCTAAVLRTNVSYCCLLFVRTRLGLPANPRSAHARDYGPVLSSHGYCTFRGSPDSAPVGAVLVYSGGASGHIEIKRGQDSYWWGPTNDGPATEWSSTRRNLKAIYTKCGGRKK